LTAREAPYQPGTRMVYRHKGTALLGTLIKSQRRAAVIEDQHGHLLTVPWSAVTGPATGKAKAGGQE
jgi:hypothetical protein